MASPPVNTGVRLPDLPPAVADQLRRAAYGGLPVNAELVNELLCAEIVAASGTLPSDATTEQAVETARLLIGAYPAIPLADPDIYARMITTAIARCPSDLHYELLDRLTDRHRRLPTKSDIAQMVNDVVTARQMLIAGAKATAREHERRRAEAAKAEDINKSRDDILERFGSYDRYFDFLRDSLRLMDD